MVNGQPVGEPINKVGVIPCSKRIEPGLFFYPGNGSNLFRAGTYSTVLNNRLYIDQILYKRILILRYDFSGQVHGWQNSRHPNGHQTTFHFWSPAICPWKTGLLGPRDD